MSSNDSVLRSLAAAAAARYAGAGRFTMGFVRGKLACDPVYRALLTQGLLPGRGRVLDLGCGRGLFPALLCATRTWLYGNPWPQEWPTPPVGLTVYGIERHSRHALIARRAMGSADRVEIADLTDCSLPYCDAALLLDVLQFLPGELQQTLLERVAGRLAPDGVLIIREADAGAGRRYSITRGAERLCAVARGGWRQAYHYRGADEWRRLLGRVGFEARVAPMSQGTPFANVMLVARPAPARVAETRDR
ncbi:MAG: SAM-dependent methyltransferase [Gammaproteobacteria bacterium]